jgi:hypothetical protein
MKAVTKSLFVEIAFRNFLINPPKRAIRTQIDTVVIVINFSQKFACLWMTSSMILKSTYHIKRIRAVGNTQNKGIELEKNSDGIKSVKRYMVILLLTAVLVSSFSMPVVNSFKFGTHYQFKLSE